MFFTENTIRVRYAETDQMAVVYHGNYAQYFEVSRVEALRSMGLSYKQMELEGVSLPVLKFETKFIRPAKYDDLLTIKTEIREIPTTRITFHHEVFNEKNELLTLGLVQLVFVDIKTGRPRKAPENFQKLLDPFFDSDN